MVTGGSSVAERWGALAGVEDPERGASMRAILEEVLAFDEAQRNAALEEMVKAEYELDDARLRPFTVSRLRTWLVIAQDNMEGAKSLARGYDAAFDKLPAAHAMRRSTTVQTVARTDLTPEEVQGLFDLIPSIVRQVPRARPGAAYRKPEQVEKKKPFWKFW